MEIRIRNPQTSHNRGCVEIIASNAVETVELLNIFALAASSGSDLAERANIIHTELAKVVKGGTELTVFKLRRGE